jgi:hypothetical protein
MRAIEEEATEKVYDYDTYNLNEHMFTKVGIKIGRGLSILTESFNKNVNYTELYKKLNTPFRVLGDALGKNTTASREFMENPMNAESEYIKNSFSFRGGVTKLLDESGIGADEQLMKKFTLWMIGRRRSDVP